MTRISDFLLRLRFGILCIAALVLSGCVAIDQEPYNPSSVDNEWLSPSVRLDQKIVDSVLVVSLTDNTTNRRGIEDIICNVFAFKGLPATPSYLYASQVSLLKTKSGGVNFTKIKTFAKKAKASNILIIQDFGTKVKTIYNPGVAWGPAPMPGPHPGFGPGPMWHEHWAIPPSVTQLQIAKSGVQLALPAGEALWMANISTVLNETTAAKTYELYADLIFNQIIKNGFMIPLNPAALQTTTIVPAATP